MLQMLPLSKYVHSMFIRLSNRIPSDILQEITTHRHRFPKPSFQYGMLNVFGSNIISSEGEEWKKYRKITAPAFSEVCPEAYLSPGPEQTLREIIN